MTRTLVGRARILGDDVNTDYIIPSRRKRDTVDAATLKRYLLEDWDPTFAASVRDGDVLVAGNNFGCGSAMEIAVTILPAAGIHAVLAKTFARTYFRNAINNGLLPLQCDTTGVDEGDRLVIGLGDTITVKNATQSTELVVSQLPPLVQRIIDAGGLEQYLKQHGGLDEAVP